MTRTRAARPGAASLALLLIVLITAAWWALALWPAGAGEPEWLVRTRAACFGSAPGGLPDAGGWIVLIGEPIGMLGVLLVVWGGRLREDFARIGADRWWRTAVAVGAGGLALGALVLGQRVAYAAGLGTSAPAPAAGVLSHAGGRTAVLSLVDQQGVRTALAGQGGRPALLTFAFGHCTTVCPTLVHDLMAARTDAGRPDVPLLIVTLDPWRDTPDRLALLGRAWAIGPKDRVLSGTVAEVDRVLKSLGVTWRRDGASGDIEHTGTVIALDDGGQVLWRLDGGWGRVRELVAGL